MENTLMTYKDFLANQSVQVDKAAFVINLILVAVLARLIAFLYVKYGRSISNRQEFSKNFVMLSMTTMIIISIVKSSLALSLGLVGALSIVRFRSAIKEPEELTFLFFCIAIGLGMGADQRLTTLIGAGIIGLVIVIKGKTEKIKAYTNYFLNISIPGEQKVSSGSIVDTITPFCKRISLQRMDENSRETNVTFSLEFENFKKLEESIDSLKKLSSDIEVSYVENIGLV